MRRFKSNQYTSIRLSLNCTVNTWPLTYNQPRIYNFVRVSSSAPLPPPHRRPAPALPLPPPRLALTQPSSPAPARPPPPSRWYSSAPPPPPRRRLAPAPPLPPPRRRLALVWPLHPPRRRPCHLDVLLTGGGGSLRSLSRRTSAAPMAVMALSTFAPAPFAAPGDHGHLY